MNKKDLISRVIKTFVEAAIGYVAVNVGAVALDFDEPDVMMHALACVFVSAVAAGVSAVWNGIIEPMVKRENKNEIDE